MTVNLMNIFDDLERQTTPKSKDTIARSPLNYPGGKSRSIDKILPYLPYRDVYVEPFGGSAAILLARHSSNLEVYNDRYGGVFAFYRCIKSKEKCDKLIELLDLTVHSREEFVWCKATWNNCEDDVNRAARWYYMLSYSFGGLSRNFGRSTSSRGTLAGKIRNAIKKFPIIHERFRRVQVENQDWSDCIRDYDGEETVFYLDPPYIDADSGIYKNSMTRDDHRSLLNTIFSTEGFVAVSGYSNPLYENQEWDDRFEWDAFVSIQSMAHTDGNNKAHLKGLESRGTTKEVLWIKE